MLIMYNDIATMSDIEGVDRHHLHNALGWEEPVPELHLELCLIKGRNNLEWGKYIESKNDHKKIVFSKDNILLFLHPRYLQD